MKDLYHIHTAEGFDDAKAFRIIMKHIKSQTGNL